MPNYDYVCHKCGKDFEVFQSMNDPRLEKCLDEGCDGKMKRLIGTGAGVIFKGSGFYETDYRSDSYKAGAKKESGGDGGGEGEGTGVADKGSGASKGTSASSDKASSSSSTTSGSGGKTNSSTE
ncbi:MAG: FmdB family zinc ribbon protein [Verrucomicrobiota bacterium]